MVHGTVEHAHQTNYETLSYWYTITIVVKPVPISQVKPFKCEVNYISINVINLHIPYRA